MNPIQTAFGPINPAVLVDQLLTVEGLCGLTSGGVATLFTCIAIVLTKHLHGRYTCDDRPGPQKLHEHPTPRVGGLAILFGLAISSAYAPVSVRELLTPMIIAAMPAFLLGLAEDISRRIPWQVRFVGTICSGVSVWCLTSIAITRVDFQLLDHLLAFAPLAVLFTAFAIGGVSNAFNIIDGLHGLSAGTAVICLAAIAAIAGLHSDDVLMHLCLIVALILCGFLLINFPFGKIFLGDGGAYLVGFVVGWTAVLLPVRNQGVSPFASLLILAYPVIEVLFSVIRRRHRANIAAHPDRLHLHSLLRQRIGNIFSTVSRDFQNAIVTPLIWSAVAVGGMFAVMAHGNTNALALAFAVMALFYVVVYWVLIGIVRTVNEAGVKLAFRDDEKIGDHYKNGL